jgi:coenzyme F420-reducing hydrogenase beta subunit
MFVCKTCGDFHAEASAVCCGQVVTPLEEAIGVQDKLFELTGNDKAQNVLHSLKALYESAAESVRKTESKLVERHMKEQAAETLLNFYKLTVESAGTITQ